MNCRCPLLRLLFGVILLTAVDCGALFILASGFSSPAQAQFRDDRFPFLGRQRPSRSGGGFFGGFFGGSQRSYENPYEQPQAPVDNSRAPPPRKVEAKTDAVAPTTFLVVMGDGMADWLAYGLEDAFSDSPEVAIIRKNKVHSGLLRYESKGDLDWAHVARDILNGEKASYVIMMLGVSDRQSIRERDLAREAENKKKEQAEKKAASDKDVEKKEQGEDQEQESPAAPETQTAKKAGGVIEFRTERWAEIYSKRIDETIAALKSKGVPVFWVGLPSIRGSKSTADVVYLNDLYRARAERAGVVYIDIWDGFVDESGKYSNFGPDYEGQMRRLRSSDGLYFTKNGALKLAHYVEREIRRYMNSRATPIALPSGPITAPVPDGKPAARPVAGPIVPLTITPANSEELLGGHGNSSPHSDAVATRVLVKGEPVPAAPGRADDFSLRRDSEGGEAPASLSAPAAAIATAPAAPAPAHIDTKPPETAAAPPPPEKKVPAPKAGATARSSQNAAKPRIQRAPPRDDAPRPPRPISGTSPFSLFR
ncbi:MAG TPA: DUF459 domain-containing protein [Pseudolabrys sp.]|nr:DUF459 domain-containing protein [Pseudolabrys sp.]